MIVTAGVGFPFAVHRKEGQPMYFQVWQGRDTKWYWHLRAANNEIIAQGEGYVSKQGALNAIDLVKSSHSAPVKDAVLK
jgi:uncharacterized protein YegP (UPF0339 family)